MDTTLVELRSTGEPLWEPEVLRVRGELARLTTQTNEGEAEAAFLGP
jgi:hypothetical protein